MNRRSQCARRLAVLRGTKKRAFEKKPRQQDVRTCPPSRQRQQRDKQRGASFDDSPCMETTRETRRNIHGGAKTAFRATRIRRACKSVSRNPFSHPLRYCTRTGGRDIPSEPRVRPPTADAFVNRRRGLQGRPADAKQRETVSKPPYQEYQPTETAFSKNYKIPSVNASRATPLC